MIEKKASCREFGTDASAASWSASKALLCHLRAASLSVASAKFMAISRTWNDE
jgi:hypothetical protein